MLLGWSNIAYTKKLVMREQKAKARAGPFSNQDIMIGFINQDTGLSKNPTF